MTSENLIQQHIAIFPQGTQVTTGARITDHTYVLKFLLALTIHEKNE